MSLGETRELKRSIGNRQLSMIAIGGAIGTGLFFASGAAIAQAGPGGALLAYATMGLAVYLHDAVAGRDGDATADSRLIRGIRGALRRSRRWPSPSAGTIGSVGPLRWQPSWSPAPSSCSFGFRIRIPRTGPWVFSWSCWH